MDNVFKKIDADKDNQLSKEEVKKLAFFKLNFCFALRVASFCLMFLFYFACVIFKSWFWLKVAGYIKKHIPTPEHADSDNPAQDPLKITEEIFQHEDQDRDGYISFDEFSGPKHDEL